MSFNKQNFSLNERVEIHSLGVTMDGERQELEGATGYILGKSFENVLDAYMVMLDKPLPNALAVQMTEACLRRI
jgi:hypothetical protein